MHTGISLLTIQTNLPEIIFFGFITLILGFIIHYLWTLRHGNMEMQEIQQKKYADEAHQWRLKYYELTEQRQAGADDLQRQLEKAHTRQIEMQEEMEELQNLNKQLLQSTREIKSSAAPVADDAASELQQQLENALARQVEMQEELNELNELNKLLRQSAKEKKPVTSLVTETVPDNEMQKELEKAHQRQMEMQQELQQLKEKNDQLLMQLKSGSATAPSVNTNDYLQQLKTAQEYLSEHNQTIARLLQQSESMEQVQEKYRQAAMLNETLNQQLLSVQNKLRSREEEIELINQRADVTSNMKEQLETAYAEFRDMQEKMQRVELHLAQPAGQILKYEELEEANRILRGETEHARAKQKELTEENSKLEQQLTELETKIRELEFEKQQFEKRNEFLEQLNYDLQQMSDQNQRMVTQMRRLTEIEGMLSKISSSNT
ncbi:MAG: hypothetical protein K2X48_12830 [Chitinophagaceae bacterium]|nr:hypothetical protein [Chitinophagaceae bacterium]